MSKKDFKDDGDFIANRFFTQPKASDKDVPAQKKQAEELRRFNSYLKQENFEYLTFMSRAWGIDLSKALNKIIELSIERDGEKYIKLRELLEEE